MVSGILYLFKCLQMFQIFYVPTAINVGHETQKKTLRSKFLEPYQSMFFLELYLKLKLLGVIIYLLFTHRL